MKTPKAARYRKWLGALLIMIAVSGCASLSPEQTAEREIAQQKLQQIRTGIRRQEVERVLEPNATYIIGHNVSGFQSETYKISEHYYITIPYWVRPPTVKSAKRTPVYLGPNEKFFPGSGSDGPMIVRTYDGPNDRVFGTPTLQP